VKVILTFFHSPELMLNKQGGGRFDVIEWVHTDENNREAIDSRSKRNSNE